MDYIKFVEEISTEKIQDKAYEYFYRGKVIILDIFTTSDENQKIIAEVTGKTRVYSVNIEITKNEDIYYSCTCNYALKGACLHVIGTLYQLNYEAEFSDIPGFSDSNDSFEEIDDFDDVDYKMPFDGDDSYEEDYDNYMKYSETATGEQFLEILNKLEKSEEDYDSKLIAFVQLNKQSWGQVFVDFSFKLKHENQTVDVYNLSKFGDAYIYENDYTHRNKIIYSPNIHKFSNSTERFIEKLNSFTRYNKITGSIRFNLNSAFDMIELLIETNIEFYVNNKKFSKENDFKFDFQLINTDNKIELQFLGKDIVSYKNFIYSNNNLYWIENSNKNFIYSMLNFFEKNTIIDIDSSNSKYIGNLLQKYSSNLNFISNNQELLGIEKVEMSFYFDKDDENFIECKIESLYKNNPIDIFDNTLDIYGRNEVLEDIEKYLLKNGFYGENGIYKLIDDTKIYSFLSSQLNPLKERGNVYFSKKFELLKINKSFKIDTALSYSESGLLSINFSLDDIEEITLSHLINSFKQHKNFIRLKDGSFLDLQNKKLETLSETMKELDKNNLENLNFPKNSLLYLNSKLKSLKLGKFEISEEIKKTINNFKMKTPFQLNDYYKSILRTYQKDGIDWLAKLSKFNLGGILADDMGLGKTVQVLAYINSLEENGKSLIVVPKSLLYNWTREIEKFAKNLDYKIIDGTKSQRTTLIKEIQDQKVILTSYSLLREDITMYNDIHFEYIFIDEAQHIKNPTAKLTKAVKQIKGEKRFALTGTPIENRLDELWSIFDYIMPSYLHSLGKFDELYGDLNKNRLKDLKYRIDPFILRRTKEKVLKELPEKIETEVYIELNSKEKSLYKNFIDDFKNVYNENTSKLQILTLLLKLRQICCHSKLIDESVKHKSSKQEAVEELISDALSGNHRILIFSQFTSMLKILEESLLKSKIKTFYLDGKTPAKKRVEMVDKFNGGEGDVFFISLKAGGTGLNLIGADMVIHYDPWWNPAVENQASDRIYRIGQKKNVQIIKLLTKGTIEEKIFDIQKGKQELTDSILNVENKTNFLEKDLMKLLDFDIK